MDKKSLVAGVAIVVAAGLTLTGCSTSSSSDTSSSAAATTSTINTALLQAPTEFNPALSSASGDVQVARLGFDTLLRKGTNGLIGGLATKWKSVSASKYEFTIRDGATCSDGTKISAKVVAASLEYLAGVDNSAAQTLRNQVFGTAKPTVTADDSAKTVTIDLSSPYSQLLAGMSREGTGIICPAGLANLKGLAAGTVKGAWSGPYTLTKFSAGVSATYTLRSDYDSWPAWSSVKGVPAKTINLSVSTDSNTTANLLSTGGIDVATFYDSNANQFTKKSTYSYVKTASSAYSLIFNEAAGSGSIFTDEKLRKAVAKSISPSAFNSAGLDGLGTPLKTVNDSADKCSLNGTSLLQKTDVAAAKTVLSGKTIRLLTIPNWQPAADYLASALRAAGATVTVSAPDYATWISTMDTQPNAWDIALGADSTATGLISQSINRYVGPSYLDGGVNIGAADNAEGYSLLQAGLASSDSAVQCKDFLAAQRTILKRVDIVPLITDTHFIISRQGFESSVFSGYWDISSMRIVK